MKKWFVFIVLAGVIVLATTVFAVREMVTEVPANESDAPAAGESVVYSGCARFHRIEQP
jgi:hypothetical protein